mgnify:CR=1 FL=1
MALSNDLISQFVKVTNDEVKTKPETTVYGTIVEVDGTKFVKIDGSEVLTPISSTADAEENERVIVAIKDHGATVTGNSSSPAARKGSVEDIGNKITEVEILVADKVSTKVFDAEKGRIDDLVSDNALIRETLTAQSASIDDLTADNATINETLTAHKAEIDDLEAHKLTATDADLKYATIENLNATNTNVYNLNATYGEFTTLTTNKFNAVDASIEDLQTNKLSASQADLKYADIDFSNIGKAAIESFYSKSGLIEDIVVGDGTVTGKLVGVTISGDLIEGNTIVAEKLVIKGSDGLYYKLNTDGVTTDTQQTDYNSLNGSIIKAKSITATKISVDDLVAFDATIGGFNITDDAIYSGVKSSVDNTTSGVYLGKDGQAVFGDSNNYFKYYKDSEGNYKLAVSAESILFGANQKSIEDTDETASNAQYTANETSTRMTTAESEIQQLANMIATLVTDGNGASLMTQTENGWTFSIGDIIDTLSKNTEDINDISGDVDSANSTIDSLKQAVNDLGVLADYVIITTYNGQPCIELGEGENNFKLRITNTQIQFADGTTIPAYLNNEKLYIEKAEVKDELQFGGFAWKIRSNGNVGLMWKGVNS